MLSTKQLTLLFFAFTLTVLSQNSKYTLLWKIEGNGLRAPSYLFGTMHVRDARAFNFSDSVMIALSNCSAFAMEIHPDTMMMDVFNGLMSGPSASGKSALKESLSEEDYERLDKKFRDTYGYSIDKLKVKNPFMIKSMLSRGATKSTDKTTFVDAWLLGVSKTLGKNIYGLEKTSDQIDFFSSVSKEKMKEEFDEILNPDEGKAATYRNKLTEIYATGDIDAIGREVEELKSFDSLLVKRNYVMVSSMMAIMKKERLFTAVGAAHLPGKEGVIALLRKNGYKVSVMPATFTHVADKFTVDPVKMKWATHTDTLNRIVLDAPGPFINLQELTGIETRAHIDLVTITTYAYYAINMSETSGLDEEKVIDNIVKGYKDRDKMGVTKEKKFTVDGRNIRELVLKTESNNMRLQLFVVNKVLYGLMVGGSEVKALFNPTAERFLASCKILSPLEKKKSDWITFSPPKAAFSVELPFEPKDRSREETGSGGGLFKINQFMTTDMGTMTNYLIRYYDYPSQTYLNDRSVALKATIDEITSKNKLMSGPDTIWKDGFEGRRFDFMIQDKYFTEARMFVRGNRIYLLMKQDLSATSKLRQDEFFNSFTFQPFEKAELYTLSGENFEVKLPGKPDVVKDTTDEVSGYITNTVDYYITNPNSGGLYAFESSDLGKFFKVKTLSDYYSGFVKNITGHSDSLISSDSITIQGTYGREFVMSKKSGDNLRRLRVWLSGNKLFYILSYVGKDELFSEESNLIFNSLKNKPVPFDIYGSKSDKVLAALQSADTVIYQEALKALEYYEFDKKDVDKLTKALAFDYKQVSDPEIPRGALLDVIAGLKEPSLTKVLIKEFTSASNSDFIRYKAAVAVARTNSVTGLDDYLKLLNSQRTLKEDTYVWRLFSPLRDSLELTRDRFDQVIPLLDSALYRESILNAGTSLLRDDSTGALHKKYFNKLTRYAMPDLAAYIKTSKDTVKTANFAGIHDYLSLLQTTTEAKDFSDNYSKAVLAEPSMSEFYQASALALRIRNHLPLDKELSGARMKDIKTRYTLLSAYDKTGELDKVDARYTNREEIGRLALSEYLSDEGDYPKEIKSLGKIKGGEFVYYAYAFTYEGDEKEYVGISGPFDEKSKAIQFDAIYAASYFEVKEKEWKEQAEKLLENF